MATPLTHERIVARLVADVEPVRPLWSPRARLAFWLLLRALPFWFAVTFGLRQDLHGQLHERLFLLELGLFIAAGATAAGVALRAAVPGSARAEMEVAFALLVAATAVVLASLDATPTMVPYVRFVTRGGRCVLCIVAFAALPWAALFAMLRRGAPLQATVAGLYAGAAAFLVAAAAVRLACPIDDKIHVLVWHAIPIAIGAALSGLAGARWCDRWLRDLVRPGTKLERATTSAATGPCPR